MSSIFHPRHTSRFLAILLGLVVIAAACIRLSPYSEIKNSTVFMDNSSSGKQNTRSLSAGSTTSASGSTSTGTVPCAEQETYLMHDGEILDRFVYVPEGMYLIVKSDQEDQDADVLVTGEGGFVVEDGAVLVLENVNFSGDGQNRSKPVFSVYGDMVMNNGAVMNFSSSSEGSVSNYGKGGFPAICIVDGTFTMNGGVISGNTNTTTNETAFGGALRAEGAYSSVIINSGTISGNKVLSSAEVTDETTVNANALGGAIAITEGASLTINGGEISGNTAGSHEANEDGAEYSICSGNGGGIAVYSSDSQAISTIYLNGGSILNNHAFRTGGDEEDAVVTAHETYGGGIFSNEYTKAVLNAGRIEGNTSDDKGGGLFLDCNRTYGGALFKNTLVTGNEALFLGGGLWFCPNGEANMFSAASADGLAIFGNKTTRRGTDGAGDDLYVTQRSTDTGVMLTSIMPGGGSNAWYQDGTALSASGTSRYTSSDAVESDTILQGNAVVNKPSEKAKQSAAEISSVVITGNHAKYGGGVASNHYLSFGTPTEEEEEEHNVPPETHDPVKISINVNKVWVGAEGQQAIVHLFANGTEAASAVLTADNNWTYTFTNLDQTDADGNEITYTLTEDLIDGYTSEITGNASSGFTVTNTNIETVDISGTKVWDDHNDQDGLRPDSVSINLLQNGTVVDTATVTADNDGIWSFTFEDLPKYDPTDGSKYSYTVTETDVPDGYTSEVTGDAVSGFIITNTHEPETTSVSVTKEWVGPAGTSVTITLLVDGTETDQTLTLSADNEWSGSFTGLAKYSTGDEIAYSVSETAVSGVDSSNYSTDITGSMSEGFVVTNTNTETVDISGTKVWNDNNDQDGLRPDSVTISLLRNGTQVDSTVVTADSDSSWSFTFEDQAKYNPTTGSEYTYTVAETNVPDGYASKVTGDAASGFTITNTHVPETTSVSVTKVWDDASNQDGLRPDIVAVQLYSGEDADGDTVELNASNDWTYTWTGLDVYAEGEEINYNVAETSVLDGYSSTVSENSSTSFTITNTHEPETTSVSVTKEWIGPAGTSVTITLLADGTETEETLTLSADNEWSGSFTGLAKYSAGEEIAYSVSETAVSGVDSSNYSTDITGSMSEGFVVTNTNTETVDISGTKVWDDNNDQDGLRPDSVTISLLRNGTQVDSTTVTADSDGTWSFSFENLAKYDPTTGSEYTYTVAETDVPAGYTSEVTGDVASGFTITNTHVPDTTSVSVTKIWVGPAGTSATFALYADGSDTGKTLTLTADNSWTGSFDGLAKYNAGRAVVYTISETEMGGVDSSNYSTTVSGDASSGFTVTNTNAETTKVHVKIIWNQGIEDSVPIKLLKNDEETGDSLIIYPTSDSSGSGEGWNDDFTDVPIYDSSGNKITYSVTVDKTGENMIFYKFNVESNNDYSFIVFLSYGTSG